MLIESLYNAGPHYFKTNNCQTIYLSRSIASPTLKRFGLVGPFHKWIQSVDYVHWVCKSILSWMINSYNALSNKSFKNKKKDCCTKLDIKEY